VLCSLVCSDVLLVFLLRKPFAIHRQLRNHIDIGTVLTPARSRTMQRTRVTPSRAAAKNMWFRADAFPVRLEEGFRKTYLNRDIRLLERG